MIRAVDAKAVGILVSTKVGQFALPLAEVAKKEIEKRGRKAYILVSDELDPLTIKNFMSFDAFVNTACPRLVDDVEEFERPILSMEMLRQVVKIWDESGKARQGRP